MRALTVVLIAFLMAWASQDAPGTNSADPSWGNPSLVKPTRPGRPSPGIAGPGVSIRLSVFDTSISISSTPIPQKPLRSGGSFCEQAFTSYPVEPVQTPTVTLYTF
jgi:hypothetical protein